MKLLYDHQIFTIQNYGGISRYFSELMNRLEPLPDISLSLALRYSYNENLLNHPKLIQFWSKKSNFFSNPIFPSIQNKMKINFLYKLHINQNESIRLLKKKNYDIFHPTYYDPYFLKYLENKTFCLTVYDMIHELYPEYFPPLDPTIIWKKKLIERAESIIVISQNTKNDIIKFTTVDPDRISVIYLGNPLELSEDSPLGSQNYPEPAYRNYYILFVGTRTHYKNFNFFVSSISSLFHKYEHLHLYCAGGGPFTTEEIILLKDLNLLYKVHYFAINNNIMKNLYKNAQAFVFPSLYEGFGLPILEAFSCGCPLIASQTSSLSEIAGDAARYIDPHNENSIVAGVESLLNDNDYRRELIRKGYERLKLFSWDKTARETKKVYDNIT